MPSKRKGRIKCMKMLGSTELLLLNIVTMPYLDMSFLAPRAKMEAG